MYHFMWNLFFLYSCIVYLCCIVHRYVLYDCVVVLQYTLLLLLFGCAPLKWLKTNCTHEEIFSESCWFKPNLYCIYHVFDRFSTANGFPLVLNLSENDIIQYKFGLDEQDSEKIYPCVQFVLNHFSGAHP